MNATASSVMTKRVIAPKRNAGYKEIVSALRLRQHRVSACPVISQAGKMIGVVSAPGLLFRDRLTVADGSHRAPQPAGRDAGADDPVAKVH